MKRGLYIAITTVVATIFLAGCSQGAQGGHGNSTNASLTNASASGSSNHPSTSNTTGTVNGTGNTAASNGNANAGTAADSTAESSGSNGGATTSTKSPTTASSLNLVKDSVALAAQGKAYNVPFALRQNINVVQSAWGTTTDKSAAGAGIYVTYNGHAAAFGMNKGNQIFDVRSYDSKLQSITPADVETIMGMPADTRQTSDSYIYMYPAGPDYQLLFVFPKTGSGKIGAQLSHVSVFWPQGTVDIMAQTQPAPTVKVSSLSGGQVSFSIVNPPSGYRLVELEWVPSTGTAIVNTDSQANQNRASGNMAGGFVTVSDNKAFILYYPLAVTNQSGVLRVIYQATSGAAIIGTSSKIVLK